MNSYGGFSIQVDGQVVGRIRSFDVRQERQITPIYDPSNEWGKMVEYLPGRTTMNMRANVSFVHRVDDRIFDKLGIGLLDKLGFDLLEALGEATNCNELSQRFIPKSICWESFEPRDDHYRAEINGTFYENPNYVPNKKMDDFWDKLESVLSANK